MQARWYQRPWLVGLASLLVALLTAAAGTLTAVAAGATPRINQAATPPAILRAAPAPSTPLTLTTPQSDSVQVTSTPASAPLPTGFLGFSIETNAIHSYLGRNPDALNPVFMQLVEGLDQGFAPILRIGGDSSDYTYVPMPGYVPPIGVTYEITPDWLDTVAALAQQTGTRLILGVNLAADDPQETAVEAREMVNTIGISHIDALEIGNEPDLYATSGWYRLANGEEVYKRGSSYRFPGYLADAEHWKDLLPDVPLAGAAWATLSWGNDLSSLTANLPNLAMVTVHRYPLSACQENPSSGNFASDANLLSSAGTEGLASAVAPYALAMNEQNVSFRVDELNSASCEGKAGVSNTFASALWMLNELFDMAAAGVDGINVHTLPGSNYAPFSFTDSHGSWSGVVNPVYYGMLMFAQAFPPGAELLNTANTLSVLGGNVKSYATLAPDGTLRTTIINESGTRPADVTLTEPFTGNVSVDTLSAPALTSTTGISLGQQSFPDPTTRGTLPGPITSTIGPDSSGAYQLTLAPRSAVLLTGAQVPSRR